MFPDLRPGLGVDNSVAWNAKQNSSGQWAIFPAWVARAYVLWYHCALEPLLVVMCFHLGPVHLGDIGCYHSLIGPEHCPSSTC